MFKDLKFNIAKRLLNSLDDRQKHQILTFAVKKHYCAISEEDILKQKEDKWFYMDKALDDTELKLLKSEVVSFSNTRFWKILKTEIEYQANKRMFLISKNENDLIAGKIALFNLDVIKSVINRITQSK